mmetsp:Transcript_27228/g.52471  ORF Transcript_27228/g.52471 Transcript_27228/m.52471 type:complete len:431 (+) Transcript_27228:62-1354(+)
MSPDNHDLNAPPSMPLLMNQKPLWIIHGHAFDLTDWIPRHPGGSLILLQVQGTDCTALFESYHALTKKPVNEMLKKYYIRDAFSVEMDASCMFNWEAMPKYKKIQEQVQCYFKNTSSKAPWWVMLWYAIWLVVLMCSCYYWATYGCKWASIVFGLSMWYTSGDMLHTGSHYGICKDVRLNIFLAYAFGVFHHIPSAWVRQHVMGHHAYTNTKYDPDLKHHYDWGWRNSPQDQPLAMHTQWKLRYPMLTLLTGVGPAIGETISWLTNKPDIYGKSNILWWEHGLILSQWLFYVAIFVLAVCYHGACIGLMPLAIHGTIYSLVTQPTHINTESFTDEDQSREWAVHQFQASRGDYSQSSLFLTFATVGLNLQSVHHLFPNVHWCHYPALYPIVCEAMGEPCVHKSWRSSYICYLKHLRQLNGDLINRHTDLG